MSSDFLDIFSGTGTEEKIENNIELMYRPSEQVFGSVAEILVQNGWSIYPQDTERRPGRVNGETIAWQHDHKLSEKLPKAEHLKKWVQQCSTLNVASVMGPGSGYTCAIDIDVLDKEKSDQIVELAEKILGRTPFIRVGRAPKIALIYRYDPDDPVQSVSRNFAEKDSENNIYASENAVEILGQGKSITFLGKHHKTGRYFQWIHKSPINYTPLEAPVITNSLVADFMEAVNGHVQNFHRGSSILVQTEDVEWDENSEVKIPKLKSIAGNTPWVEDKNGRVVDGRNNYLMRLVYRFVQANPSLPIENLVQLVTEQFVATADTSGRWSPNKVSNEVRGNIKRLKAKVKRGEIVFPLIVQNKEGKKTSVETFKLPFSKAELKERGLEFLPPEHKRRNLRGKLLTKKEPVVLTEEERQTKIQDIQTGLRDALDTFFEDMFMANCGENPEEVRVHVIKAPTGAGKTSQTLRYIGEKKQEHLKRANRERVQGERDSNGNIIVSAQGLNTHYVNETGVRKDGKIPIVFLLPTYSNIEEVRIRAEVLNLDNNLSDEELKNAAKEKGIIPETELDARLSDLKRDAMNADLDVMVYKGKVAAGCKMSEKVQAAMEAGVGTAAFCKSSVKNQMGESEEVFCPHYHECPAIQQREMIQEHDLIFTPHPFMQLEIPEPLKHARAVIADERIHHLFLHTTEFPLNNLSLPRKAPKITKKERENGITEFDLAQSREIAVELVTMAFAEGSCPAKKLFYYNRTEDSNSSEMSGFRLVEDCIRICTSAIQKDVNINPNMSIDEVKELCAQPTGRYVREEQRFWKIIKERMDALNNYNLQKVAIHEIEQNIKSLTGPKDITRRDRELKRLSKIKNSINRPYGEKDMRIQFVQDHISEGDIRSVIRISWRSEPNWHNLPLLLLDASASPEIINKIWNGAEVVTHDISGPLHIKIVGVVNRTFSNASIIGNNNDNEAQKIAHGKNLNKMRRALASVSSWFGFSRVVAGSSILTRRIMNTNWAGPENVDWCHFGAMRGLDFAKHHAAAFSIGRMELPIRTIDGLVAALTYDDAEPEHPYDIEGTGLTKDGEPLLMPSQMQTFQLRSGEVVEIPTPMHPGKWGRLIQKQYREEELLQFMGRLRPVYRKGEAPIWFALSSVIPQELVIDDLIHIDDLVTGKSYFWDAVRRTHGIIHADVLYKTCPEYFKDRQDAENVMNEFGFSSHSYENDFVYGQGFTPFYFYDLYNVKSVLFLRSEYKNKKQNLLELLTELKIPFSDFEEIIENTDSIAVSRTPDKVDITLGDIYERKTDEKKNADQVALDVFMNGLKRRDEGANKALIKSHPVTFAAGKEGNLRNMWVHYTDLESKKTLEIFRLEEQKKRELKTILEDNEDNYSELGNTTTDE